MDGPDFSKYDETQLRQILARIDREKFPERVNEIEARLQSFDRGDAPTVDSTEFSTLPLPEGVRKVFGPALPFFAIGAISIIWAVLADSTERHSMLQIANPIGLIAILVAFVIVYFRLSTIACPNCQRECKRKILENRNWGAICQQCQINWDTGAGSDD